MRIKNRLGYALLAASATASICTGLVYGYFLYFCQSDDPYSVLNHPLQPLFRTLHIVTTPALAMMLGVFWIGHAWPYIQKKHRKGLRTGLLMVATALPMIFSGYFLQVVVAENWKAIWMWTHIISSLLWILGLLAHFISHRMQKKRMPRQNPA